jgi:hypothetical protein
MTEAPGNRGGTVVMVTSDAPGAPGAIAHRSEFVRAFVEHAGARPASERIMVRWPTLMTVTALVAVGTLVVGIFWSLVSPAKDPRKQAAAQAPNGVPSAGTPSTWTAVAGWDCTAAPDHGFEATGRAADWRTVMTGGWNKDDCRGAFQSIPVPAANDDKGSQQAASWWFTPPVGINSCRISVYVPVGGGRLASAVKYSVSANAGGTPYGRFTTNQARNASRWVDAGTYPVQQNRIAVAMSPVDTEAATSTRIALAQMKVNCGR